jgi:hypothetical protein
LLLKNVLPIKTKSIGVSRFRVSATQPHELLCLALHLAHTAQIAQGEYSQATAVANGYFEPCIKQGLLINSRQKTEMMDCNSPMHG